MALPIAFLFFAGTFAVVLAAIWIARLFIDSKPDQPNEQGYGFRASEPSLFAEDSPLLRRGVEVSSIDTWAWVLQRADLVNRLKRTLSQAGLDWSVGRVTASMLFCASITLAVLGQFSWLPWWGKLALSLLAGAIPYYYIVGQREKRWRKIEEQFPDALESLARALRAGHPFSSALENTSNQTPAPLGRELRLTFTEGAFGMTWEEALENLCNRLPMEEVCTFAAAVQMQSRSGGNLSEVLDKLSENMREASAIRGEVRSLSAQGRAAGLILSILPFGIALILLSVNPKALDPLLQEEVGRILLTGAVLGLIAAHFIIRKLVDIRL